MIIHQKGIRLKVSRKRKKKLIGEQIRSTARSKSQQKKKKNQKTKLKRIIFGEIFRRETHT